MSLRPGPLAPTVLSLALLSLLAVSAPVRAAESLVLDYRNAAFRDADPAPAAKARERIAKALTAAPADVKQSLKGGFAVLGEAKGAISGKGEETAYLLSPRRPVTSDPSPEQRQVVAVLAGDKLVGAYLLPETGYARLVGTVPAPDGAGRDLLLEGSFMNMGQTVTALDAVRLGPGETASVRQSLKDVYVDGCDNPIGPKSRKAALVTVDGTSGAMTPAWEDLSCEGGGR